MIALDELSLEEKIGQLFLVRFSSRQINSNIINLIANFKISGVVYHQNDFKNTKQIHHLSKKIQNYANAELPLFIAPANINTLPQEVTKTFSPKEIGYLNNLLYTKQMAEIHGRELQTLGMNLHFEPHLQTGDIDPHSYGNDTAYITRHATATIRGFQHENVIAAVQASEYFAHLKASNQHRRTRLARHFQKLLAEITMLQVTSNQADIKFIRDEILYDGVIVRTCEETDNPVELLNSGVDLLFVDDDETVAKEKINQVIEAVKENRLPYQLIDQAVERILILKALFALKQLPTFKQTIFKNKHAHYLASKIKELI